MLFNYLNIQTIQTNLKFFKYYQKEQKIYINYNLQMKNKYKITN